MFRLQGKRIEVIGYKIPKRCYDDGQQFREIKIKIEFGVKHPKYKTVNAQSNNGNK